MLKFLATTENTKYIRSEDSSYICGSVDENHKRIFSTSRVVLFLIELESIRKEVQLIERE